MSTALQELDAFLKSWTVDPLNAKPAFLSYRDLLAAVPGVGFEFKSRPGVSYSLRARHEKQQGRELFVLVDVVDDEPESRWLSVCFYADMITDPSELGDFVPQGLMGEDACCFNLDEDNATMRAYIADRLREAAAKAAS
ncbi:MAG: hypothetical protein MSH25_04445 [Desulfovibrio sp.]|uniref:hypothetical protein n=1 Tax=Desulfovibrio sp. TaxID=885 RepID=UPI0025C30BF0|nr:hypothetical protein [Desulfovibrio sp.]MCI7568610.1 hypothetical protein [Desulfovibrio sp.]